MKTKTIENEKRRKLFFISIFFIVFLGFFIIADLEYLTITVENINTTAGAEDVSVPINLANNVTVYGIQIGISHSPDITLQNISLSERMNGSIMEFNDIDDEILIVAISENGISPGNGTIFNLIFDISPNANGTYVLNSTNSSGANINTLFYTLEFIPGNLTINT